MNDTAYIYIIIALLLGGSVGIGILVFLSSASSRKKTNSADERMQRDFQELTRSVTSMQQALGDRLDRNSSNIQSAVQSQLTQSSRLIADVTQRLAKLDETNRRVVDVADELKTLQNVLQNPKQRGVFGEYYLASVLENILPPGQFKLQYKFRDGEIVDCVILLEKGIMLPVDSKFSLENYNRYIEATDKNEKMRYLGSVKNDLKKRIDETSKYIRPSEHTMDFAFMFIPSEALYYDLLIGGVGTGTSARDLIEYAFRDKRVIIVSPTSFMAYLQTVLQGLRSLQIEEQAKDIQVRVGQLSVHIGKFDSFMQKLGSGLTTTVNHYNAAYRELGKIDKDIVRIANTDPAIEPELIDIPQPRE